MPSLSVRWVSGWSKVSWNDGRFYLEGCPAWLPLLYHGGSLKCLYVMPTGSALVSPRTESGTKGLHGSFLSGSSFFLPLSCHRSRDWQCLFSGFSLLICCVFQAESPPSLSEWDCAPAFARRLRHWGCRGNFAAAWAKDSPPAACVEAEAITTLDSWRSK